MRREGVTDQDGSRAQFRRKELPNVCGESFSVDCAFDHPRRYQAVMGQTRDERLRAPSAEGRGHFQALARQAAPSQARQVGFDGSFVNKYKRIGMRLHFGDATFEPFLPQMFYPHAQPFGRVSRHLRCQRTPVAADSFNRAAAARPFFNIFTKPPAQFWR